MRWTRSALVGLFFMGFLSGLPSMGGQTGRFVLDLQHDDPHPLKDLLITHEVEETVHIVPKGTSIIVWIGVIRYTGVFLGIYETTLRLRNEYKTVHLSLDKIRKIKILNNQSRNFLTAKWNLSVALPLIGPPVLIQLILIERVVQIILLFSTVFTYTYTPILPLWSPLVPLGLGLINLCISPAGSKYSTSKGWYYSVFKEN